jgi:hypothetical protein
MHCAGPPITAPTSSAVRAPPNPVALSGKLPKRVFDALEHCLTPGRGGRGCAIVFSAGNDGSDLALNGYECHPGVIAVGACNCHGTHPRYSGHGEPLWCSFPATMRETPSVPG